MKNFKLTNKAKKTFMVSATVVLGSLNGCYIYMKIIIMKQIMIMQL